MGVAACAFIIVSVRIYLPVVVRQARIFPRLGPKGLIGVASYEPDHDRLESMWSPDIFGEMMAISCKKIEFQTNRQHSSLND